MTSNINTTSGNSFIKTAFSQKFVPITPPTHKALQPVTPCECKGSHELFVNFPRYKCLYKRIYEFQNVLHSKKMFI